MKRILSGEAQLPSSLRTTLSSFVRFPPSHVSDLFPQHHRQPGTEEEPAGQRREKIQKEMRKEREGVSAVRKHKALQRRCQNYWRSNLGKTSISIYTQLHLFKKQTNKPTTKKKSIHWCM